MENEEYNVLVKTITADKGKYAVINMTTKMFPMGVTLSTYYEYEIHPVSFDNEDHANDMLNRLVSRQRNILEQLVGAESIETLKEADFRVVAIREHDTTYHLPQS